MAHFSFDHILFPTDLSTVSKKAFKYVLALARKMGGKITLLHVIEQPDARNSLEYTLDYVRRLREISQEELDQMVSSGIEDIIQAKVVLDGDPLDMILEYAESHPVDLIVMATHGRKGFERFLLGSVAEKVVRSATCPVTTIRITEKDEEEAS